MSYFSQAKWHTIDAVGEAVVTGSLAGVGGMVSNLWSRRERDGRW